MLQKNKTPVASAPIYKKIAGSPGMQCIYKRDGVVYFGKGPLSLIMRQKGPIS